MSFTRTVHTVTPKATDVEIHVSTITVENGDRYTEIREYVVSLQQYGRGITFPEAGTEGVLQGLEVALGRVPTGYEITPGNSDG